MHGLKLTEEETRAIWEVTMPTNWLVSAHKIIVECVAELTNHLASHCAMTHAAIPNAHIMALEEMADDVVLFQQCFDKCVFLVVHEYSWTRMAKTEDWPKSCRENWQRLFDIGVGQFCINTTKLIRQGIVELKMALAHLQQAQAVPNQVILPDSAQPLVFGALKTYFESLQAELKEVWDALVSDCQAAIVKLTASLHNNHFRDVLLSTSVVMCISLFVVILTKFDCFGNEYKSFTISPQVLLFTMLGSVLALTRIPDIIRSLFKVVKSGASGS